MATNVQCMGNICTIKIHLTTIDISVSPFAFHAAGECRRRVKYLTNVVKNVNILEIHDHIWNHHEKHIEISTNWPGIGSLICEIALQMSEM